MISPRVIEERPWRSDRARSLRWKPSSAIASPTFAAVSAATPGSPLITRDTVFRLTPARCATSRMVGLVAPRTTILLTPPSGPTTLTDNVVGGTVTGTWRECQVPPATRARPQNDPRPSRWDDLTL